MATTTEKKLPTEQPIVPTWVESTPLTVPPVAPVAPVAPVSTVEAIRAAKARANVANVQAQVDANNLAKAPVTPPVAPAPTVPQTPWQEVAQRNLEAQWIDVSKLKPLEPLRTPAPTTIKPPITEVSDVEKQAQSSGVPYTMVNGQAQYNPKTREEAIKVLQTGGSFAQESKMTAQAKSSLDKLRKLTALNDTQLADAIYQGKVSAEELNQLKVVNPQVVALAQERSKNLSTAQVQNNVMSTYGTGEIKYTNTALDNLNRTLSEIDSNGDYKTIKDEVYAQYPEMDNLRKNITQTTVDIRGIQEAIRQQANDLKERLKGLPMSTILTMASAKNKPLTDQLYALQDQLTLDSAEYNAQLDQAKDEIDFIVKDNENKETRALFLYWKARDEEIRQEDFVRADKILADQIARTDKKDAETLARLEQERADNVKLALAWIWVSPVGQTYDELLWEYATAVKNQPQESKVISGIKPWEMIYQDGKFITAPWAVWAGNVTPNRPNIRYETNANNWGVTVNVEAGYAWPEDRRTKYAGGYQCWQFVNDVAGIGVGDTLTEKENMISKDLQATPWAAFVEDIGNVGAINGKPTGHIGIIEKVYDDGSFDVVEANYAEPWKVTRSTISPWDKRYNNIKWFVQTDLMKEPEAQPLSDKQYTQYNQAFSKFTQEPTVKSFEWALTSGGDLMASLNSANWPWDVGAVFQFMKTLDPSSTVREGEFALAAKSAGVWEQFKNIPANKLEGTILTEEQRMAFGKLALEYVKNKAKAYDVKYNDLTRILKNQWIPESYYPTKMSDFISQYAEQKTPEKPNIFKQGSIGGEASVDSSTIF